VDNFKIDQPRPVALFIIDHIGHTCIAVRPRSPEFFAPELVRSPEFGSGCFHHSSAECATIQVFPEALARQPVDTNRVFAQARDAKSIAVEHLETIHFPALPVFRFGPETNRQAGNAKI
jgi:hypothetical protein